MKSLKNAIVLALAVFVMATLAVSAAPTTVVQGTAVVDGNKGEWNTTIGGADWYSPMCTGNDVVPCTGAEHGDVFLRYDCTAHTLFALMLADRGFPYTPGQANNWIAVGAINHKVVSDGSPFTTNTSPPMWRDLTTSDGAEAAINKDENGTTLVNGGTYLINFHIEVAQTATSGTGFISVKLPCPPSAVTVSSISAENTDSGMNLALLALSGAGLVVLGGLVFVAARKR